MHPRTELGHNRTGTQIAPALARRMTETAAECCPDAGPDGMAFEQVRADYIHEAEPVGTVPPPGTLRGLLTTGVARLNGRRAEVLVDRIGERLAFERTGTRLYEALIHKCRAAAQEGIEAVPPIAVLERFHDEEARHFRWLVEALEQLGADPTAQTPCADAAAVLSSGVMQVLTDPRTSVTQSLNAMLVAEAADQEGWVLLIQLAARYGQTALAERFRTAQDEESEHLATVRRWLHAGVMQEV